MLIKQGNKCYPPVRSQEGKLIKWLKSQTKWDKRSVDRSQSLTTEPSQRKGQLTQSWIMTYPIWSDGNSGSYPVDGGGGNRWRNKVTKIKKLKHNIKFLVLCCQIKRVCLDAHNVNNLMQFIKFSRILFFSKLENQSLLFPKFNCHLIKRPTNVVYKGNSNSPQQHHLSPLAMNLEIGAVFQFHKIWIII